MDKYRKFELQVNGNVVIKGDDEQRFFTHKNIALNTLIFSGIEYEKEKGYRHDEQGRATYVFNIITK